MAEMEKEGRPPENKRSRKPAHPVKREINEEMKSFAENTMNELLGWYGYDKVELRDSDDLEIRNYPDGELRQHISVLKENSLPKASVLENSGSSPPHANSSRSTPTPRNGVMAESSVTPSSSAAPSAKEHGGVPIIVPLIPPPLIKPPAEEDGSTMQIVCAWCQKVGVKRYSLSMGSELKSFCSEKCFAACRRAYFKRNKVCDWCKHIRHTKEYLDFGAGERRLQFCSAKCLNQYKMDIFYKETQAALPGGLCNPSHAAHAEGKGEGGSGIQLLTPESWSSPLAELRRKAPSPAGGAPVPGPSGSTSGSPSEQGAMGSSCSSSSSSSTKIPTPRPHESPTLPHPHPPPVPSLHPPLGVPPGSPPMVMTPRGPMPLPLFMEHQMMQQIRPPPFLRPPHPPGPNSPLTNPMIPGIGPPPSSRTLGPPSSPMHRPLLSPHLHPNSTPTLAGNPPGVMPPHHAAHMPGLPFPPVNMMPTGPLPMPPVMNFGMPSLAPLVPPPTLLVPYPVIVPLPVPIPIPVPIPFSPKASGDRPGNDGTLPTASGEQGDSRDPRPLSPSSSSRGEGGDYKRPPPGSDTLSPGSSGSSEKGRTNVVDPPVKTENPSSARSRPSGCSADTPTDGVIDLTTNRRSRQQQVIQRALPCVQVKAEPESAPPTGQGVAQQAECDAGRREYPSRTAAPQIDTHKDRDSTSPLGPVALPCADPSLCGATPPSSQPVACAAPAALPGNISTATTEPSVAAALCNVIVNGASAQPQEGPVRTPPPEQRPLVEPCRRAATAAGEEAAGEELLEGEELKENSCSTAERDTAGKRGSADLAAVTGGTGAGKLDDPVDAPSGEDHAYALPLVPKPGCVIQPVPKTTDKTVAILPCGMEGPIMATGLADLEPPLKRRCLRIRNQNK